MAGRLSFLWTVSLVLLHFQTSLSSVEYICRGTRNHDAFITVFLELTSGPNCTGPVSSRAVSMVEAVEAVLARVNGDNLSSEPLIPGNSIGARYLDICSSGDFAVKLLSDQLSHSNWRGSSTSESGRMRICRLDNQGVPLDNEVPLIGVVGPIENAHIEPVAKFAADLNIPVMSPVSSSHLLENRAEYPTLFQMSTTRISEVTRGMVYAAHRLSWSLAVAITTDDKYGSEALHYLHGAAQERGICIKHNYKLPGSLTLESAHNLSLSLGRSNRTVPLGVFYMGSARLAAAFFRHYFSYEFPPQHPLIWIASDDVARSPDVLSAFLLAPHDRRSRVTLLSLSPVPLPESSRAQIAVSLADRLTNITAGLDGGLDEPGYHDSLFKEKERSLRDMLPEIGNFGIDSSPLIGKMVDYDYMKSTADAVLSLALAYASAHKTVCSNTAADDDQRRKSSVRPSAAGDHLGNDKPNVHVVSRSSASPPTTGCRELTDKPADLRATIVEELYKIDLNINKTVPESVYEPWGGHVTHRLQLGRKSGRMVRGRGEALGLNLIEGNPPDYKQIGEIHLDTGKVVITDVHLDLPHSPCYETVCLSCHYAQVRPMNYHYEAGDILIAGSGTIRGSGCLSITPRGYLRFETFRFAILRLRAAYQNLKIGFLYVDDCHGKQETSQWVTALLEGRQKVLPINTLGHWSKGADPRDDAAAAASSDMWEGELIDPLQIIGWVAAARGLAAEPMYAVMAAAKIPVISYGALVSGEDTVFRPYLVSSMPAGSDTAKFLANITQELCGWPVSVLYAGSMTEYEGRALEFERQLAAVPWHYNVLDPDDPDEWVESIPSISRRVHVYFGDLRTLLKMLERLSTFTSAAKAWQSRGHVLIVSPNEDLEPSEIVKFNDILKGSVFVRYHADAAMRSVADGSNVYLRKELQKENITEPIITQTFSDYVSSQKVLRNSPSYNPWIADYWHKVTSCPSVMIFFGTEGKPRRSGKVCDSQLLPAPAKDRADSVTPFIFAATYTLGVGYLKMVSRTGCAFPSCFEDSYKDSFLKTLHSTYIFGYEGIEHLQPFSQPQRNGALYAYNILYNAEDNTTFSFPLLRGTERLSYLTVYDEYGTLNLQSQESCRKASTSGATLVPCGTDVVKPASKFPSTSIRDVTLPGLTLPGVGVRILAPDGTRLPGGDMKDPGTSDSGTSTGEGGNTTPTPAADGDHTNAAGEKTARAGVGGSRGGNGLDSNGHVNIGGGGSDGNGLDNDRYVIFISLLSVLSLLLFILIFVLAFYMVRRNQRDHWIANRMALASASGHGPMDGSCSKCRHIVKRMDSFDFAEMAYEQSLEEASQHRAQPTPGQQLRKRRRQPPSSFSEFQTTASPDINSLPRLKHSRTSSPSIDSPNHALDIRSLRDVNSFPVTPPEIALAAVSEEAAAIFGPEDDTPSHFSTDSRGKDSGCFGGHDSSCYGSVEGGDVAMGSLSGLASTGKLTCEDQTNC